MVSNSSPFLPQLQYSYWVQTVMQINILYAWFKTNMDNTFSFPLICKTTVKWGSVNVFCGYPHFRKACCLCLHVRVIKEVTRLYGQGSQGCGYSEPGHGKKTEKPWPSKQEGCNGNGRNWPFTGRHRQQRKNNGMKFWETNPMLASKDMAVGYSGTQIGMGGKALSRPPRILRQCLWEIALILSGEKDHLVLRQNLLLFISQSSPFARCYGQDIGACPAATPYPHDKTGSKWM